MWLLWHTHTVTVISTSLCKESTNIWSEPSIRNTWASVIFLKKMRREGISKSVQGGLQQSGVWSQHINLSIYSILHSVDVRDSWNGKHLLTECSPLKSLSMLYSHLLAHLFFFFFVNPFYGVQILTVCPHACLSFTISQWAAQQYC